MNEFIAIIGITLMVCIPFGAMLMCAKQRDDLKKQAVERGYAVHNPTNGVWQWK